MTGIKEQFSSNPENVVLIDIAVSVSGTATQFASGSASMFRLQAGPGNSGNLFISNAEAFVGKWPLAAGYDTGWIPGTLMERYWWYGEVPNDSLHVWILR